MDLYQVKTDLPFSGYCESRIGGRPENQDSYGFQDTPFGLLVTVCDGMGGGPGGKTASTIAVNEIIGGVMKGESDASPKNVLLKAINRANMAILEEVNSQPELKGMGTTCTALLINENSALVAHVGDSRVYQLRNHQKVYRTFDHSMVFELVKQKVITEEQARLSEQSNYITRALGLKAELEVDVAELPYEKGDLFLLCTDGVHGAFPEKELMEMTMKKGSLGQVVDDIATAVDGAGRSKGGGHDNLTIALIETNENSILKEKMNKKTKLILAGITILLIGSLVVNITQCSTIRKYKNNEQSSISADSSAMQRNQVYEPQKTDSTINHK